MRYHHRLDRLIQFSLFWGLAALFISGCHQNNTDIDQQGDVFDTPSDRDDADEQDSDDNTSDDSNPQDGQPPESTTFPQAVHGAFWANPLMYDHIPIHIRSAGETVVLEVGDTEYSATAGDSPYLFVAEVDISALALGAHPLTVRVDDERITDAPTLHIGQSGMQFTNWDTVGSAATPRLHQVDGRLFLTWRDQRGGTGRAWFQEIDGAGVGLGEPVGISPADQSVRLGRAVVTPSHVCLLYQEQVEGNSVVHRNWFSVTDHLGNDVIAPIPLDAVGEHGLHGGDIAYDKEGCVAVWHKRTGSPDLQMQIEWVRVHLGTLDVAGPVTVTTSGDDDPIGSFLTYTFIHLAPIDDHYMITFTRDLYNSLLDLSVLTNYATIVDQEGTVLFESILPTPYTFPFAIETKVSQVHGQWIPLWTASDLSAVAEDDCSSGDCNADIEIFGTIMGGVQDPSAVEPTIIISDDQNRSQMTLIEHPNHFATMVWIDERSREDSVVDGRFELYAAAVNDSLLAGEEYKVPHARFIIDSSELGGQSVGSNVMLVWIDERKGGSSIINPRPEIYLETLWYPASSTH